MTFEINIKNIYGDQGKAWLNKLPALVDELAKKYKLTNLKPVNNLSYNYVVSGYKDAQPIILKLSLDEKGLKKEAAALEAFANYGAVKLLAQCDGALLLDQAIPGTSLRSYFSKREEESIHVACNVMKQLHCTTVPKTKEFPLINNWLKALDKEWNIPAQYMQKARQLRNQLLSTSSEPVLLHGDLHHDNILQNKNTWLVIDPKGVIGEPIYEVAAFIRNPIPELLDNKSAREIIKNRINLFADLLQLDTLRIQKWCFVQTVLSWTWVIEDHGNSKYFEQLTKVFY